MAKVPHRVFEIYESCEEAIQQLTPKKEKDAAEATALESATFKNLLVSWSAGVTHVQFKETNAASVDTLRDDFVQLAEKLDLDGRVAVDFNGVDQCDSALIDTLMLFNKKLRTKGSRIVLCCLDANVRDSFFGRR